MEIQGKRVIVVGAGASGVAASILLSRHEAEVVLADDQDPALDQATRAHLLVANVSLSFRHSAGIDSRFDLAVVSPGVPAHSPTMKWLQGAGVTVWPEIELAARLAQSRIVAITGTNGKTTTTRMVEAILQRSDWRATAAGNIGLPFSEAISRSPSPDVIALEVSSFQLEHITKFRPRVAVLLNLAPDHLDRHGSLEAYYRTKARIFENHGAGDWAIVQYEALHELKSLGVAVPGQVLTFSTQTTEADLYFGRNLIVSRIPGWSGVVYDCAEGHLHGHHNVENLMATLLVGFAMQLPLSEMRLALMQFRPDSHRFEVLPPVDGVAVINDSKATNPNAMRAAIETAGGLMSDDGQLWLIAGGENKNLSFVELEDALERHVEGAFLYGQCREEMQEVFSRRVTCYLNEILEKSIADALHRAQPGDLVLFSPGCASFDQFRSYAHRGQCFRDALRSYRRTRLANPFSSGTLTQNPPSVQYATRMSPRSVVAANKFIKSTENN